MISVMKGVCAVRVGKYWYGVCAVNRWCKKPSRTPDRAIKDAIAQIPGGWPDSSAKDALASADALIAAYNATEGSSPS